VLLSAAFTQWSSQFTNPNSVSFGHLHKLLYWGDPTGDSTKSTRYHVLILQLSLLCDVFVSSSVISAATYQLLCCICTYAMCIDYVQRLKKCIREVFVCAWIEYFLFLFLHQESTLSMRSCHVVRLVVVDRGRGRKTQEARSIDARYDFCNVQHCT